MKTGAFLLFLVIIIAAGSGCWNTETEIRVLAGAGMQGPLEVLADKYSEEQNISVELVFAGSGTLQKQVEQGAEADLFFSASSEIMDGLEEKGFIDRDSRRDILENQLVLVVPRDSGETDLNRLVRGGKLVAIGDPGFVPAGRYAYNLMENRYGGGKWKGQLLYARDVRQVLNFVESGEVDGGLVYLTEGLRSEEAVIAERFSPEETGAIVHPAAVLRDSRMPRESLDFLEYVSSTDAREVFREWGFIFLEDSL